MKKYLSLLMVALFATLSFTLTSCGDDNDEPDGVNIEGTWENVTDWAATLGKQYVKFQKDGKYYEVTIDNSDGEVEVLKGKWSLKGDKIAISGSEITPVDGTVIMQSSTSMTITTMGIPQNYKKVSDSVIDKYLK